MQHKKDIETIQLMRQEGQQIEAANNQTLNEMLDK